MLRSLIWINLKGMFFRSQQKRSKTRSALPAASFALLMVFVLCSLGFSFGSLFYGLMDSFKGMGLDWFYFAIAGILSFCMCFFFSIFATKSQLFEAGDNEFLLSMPIRPVTILASRLISLLALNYLYSAIIMIPAFAVYSFMGSFTVMGVISFLLVFITLPMLAQALSCFFGWLMALAASKMRNKNVVTMVLSFAFLGVYFVFCFNSSEYLNSLIEQGETIAASVRQSILPAYLMGDAIANGSIGSLIKFIFISIIPFIVMILLLSRSFISITTSNKGMVKTVYKEKRLKSSGIGTALFKKELHRFWSSPIYILNSSMGTLFMVILSVAAIVQAETLTMMTMVFAELGVSVAVLGGVLVAACCSMNQISAPAISLEGKNLWIIRTLPVKTKTVLLSKVVPHFVITEASVLFAVTVLSILLKPTAIELLLMYLLPTSYNAFTAFFGVVVNLHFPRFDWLSETQVYFIFDCICRHLHRNIYAYFNSNVFLPVR